MAGILGVDWGERRLGFAISDPEGVVAVPLKVVEVNNRQAAIDAVCGTAAEERAERVVVGLPLDMAGGEGFMAVKVRGFVALVREQVDIPVEMWDERLSSQSADEAMDAMDIRGSKRKSARDRLAARVILQSYLDAPR